MSKTSLKAMATAAAAAGAMFATPALAVPTITCDSVTNATNCTFGNPDPLSTRPATAFTDTFTFTIAWAKVLTGSFQNFYTVITQNVNFPTGTGRSNISGGTLPSSVPFSITATPNPDIRSIGPLALGAGTYTVTVRGFSQPDGNYNGVLSLGAVPEPATWAFMILGFGLIGGALRRRRAAATTTVAFA